MSYFRKLRNNEPEKKLSLKLLYQTGKPNREPGRPANIDNDYTFAGWIS